MTWRPLQHDNLWWRSVPGTTLGAYASGATAILSTTLRQVINNDLSYWRFPSERLFQPLGMATAVLETDPSGTFVGSSFGWASGRDWARFGQLYLQDGQWDGQRILPKGWVEQAKGKSRGSKRKYGSHWWINRGVDTVISSKQLFSRGVRGADAADSSKRSSRDRSVRADP